MSQINEPHDHHFAPQGFLKQWSNEDGAVWRTRKISFTGSLETRKQMSTKSIAWKEDLYNIEDQYRNSKVIRFAIDHTVKKYGHHHNVGFNFETSVFQQVDEDGISAYKQVVEHANIEYLSDLKKHDFFRFLYLLQARNPVFLKRMTKSWIADVKPIFATQFKQDGEFRLDDLTENGNAGKLALLDIALDRMIVKHLYSKIKVFFIDVKDDPLYFGTSNYPYVAMPDIGSDTALHFLPISPKCCLVMSPNHDLLDNLKRRFTDPRNGPAAVDVVNFILSAYSTEVYSWAGQVPKDISNYIGLYAGNPTDARKIFTAKMSAIPF